MCLHGVEVPADANLLLLIGAANRDESVFASPDTFDIARRISHYAAQRNYALGRARFTR